MEFHVMKLYQAKSGFRVAAIATSIVVGVVLFFGGIFHLIDFFGGIFHLIDQDQAASQQALCSPYKLDHTFVYNQLTHGVCAKADGTIFLSEKTRK
jgi:hypothetical protein